MDLNNFAVLNACNPVNLEREIDRYVDYRSGNYFDGPKMIKKAVSWHSIPAAFQTEFFVYNRPKWQEILKYDHIMVMIKDDLPNLVPLITKLKKMNKIVGLGFHENGNYFSNSAQNLNWLMQFKQLVDMGDYFWNLNVCLEDFFKQFLDVHVFSSWHGVPYEWDHGLTVPREDRKGIMIGTRTLSQHLRRNTLYAIGIADRVAQELDTHVTYFSEDSIDVGDLWGIFQQCGFKHVSLINGPTSYEEWLKVIAPHKILFHLDASETLGQVVLDAALLDISSVGSFTTNNNLMNSEADLRTAKNKLSFAYRGLKTIQMGMLKNKTSFEGLRKHHKENLFPCL